MSKFDSYFTEENTVIITKEMKDISLDFAVKVSQTTFDYRYKKSGEIKKESHLDNHYTGTIAEFAVHSYINKIGHTCTLPNLEIKKSWQKSFNRDLVISISNPTVNHHSELNAHVKSITTDSATLNGISWLFNREDTMFRTNDFGKLINIKENDCIIIVLLDLDNDRAAVLKTVYANSLFPDFLDKPRLERFHDTKYAVYYDRFKDLDLM